MSINIIVSSNENGGYSLTKNGKTVIETPNPNRIRREIRDLLESYESEKRRNKLKHAS